MFDAVDTHDPISIEAEVRSICSDMYPDSDHAFVARAFAWATECFAGSLPDYQPIDVRYHDFEHTLQGTLCLARLLQGRHLAGVVPALTVKGFELAMLAILFHDTGYLKRRDDTEGTGAKYTAIHVERSAAFAREFLVPRGYADADVAAVGNMIHCTGINTDLKAIPFRSDLERTTGFALATADLMAQMAARDYVDKLPLLFEEFVECRRFAGTGLPSTYAFASADELMRNTPMFWERYVRPKIDLDFGGLHAFLNSPYPDGPNPYLQHIERNVARLRSIARP